MSYLIVLVLEDVSACICRAACSPLLGIVHYIIFALAVSHQFFYPVHMNIVFGQIACRTDFHIPCYGRFDRYGEVYDAFFTPAVSGVHYLWMSSDNGGEVLLTSGTNASLLERFEKFP